MFEIYLVLLGFAILSFLTLVLPIIKEKYKKNHPRK